MAFIPTLQTVRVDALQDLNGQHCENTLWYYSAGGTLDVTEMGVLGTAINSIFTTFILPLKCADWVYRGCVVTDQTSETAPAVNVFATPSPGTLSGVSAPNNVSYVIKLLTTGRGRSSRGRNYSVGIPQALITENELDSDYVASLLGAYDHFLSPSLDVDANLAVVSHFLAGAPRAAGLAQPVIAVDAADYTVDSQRRRLPGRGN